MDLEHVVIWVQCLSVALIEVLACLHVWLYQ